VSEQAKERIEKKKKSSKKKKKKKKKKSRVCEKETERHIATREFEHHCQ
jgi:hypothetical protein